MYLERQFTASSPDRSLTLEKGGAVEEDRGYSTLPPLYRKHTTPDALSNQLNSSGITRLNRGLNVKRQEKRQHDIA